MKNKFMKRLALGMAMVMTVGSLAACGSDDTATASKEESSTASSETESTEAESGEEEVASEGADTLVVAYDYFSAKFSPFFHKTNMDNDAQAMTGVSLLSGDREGNIILNGIEGETIPYNGKDYTYYTAADLEITQNDDGTVYYDFTLRDDIQFSDGTPMTIDDVIFSFYALSDPTYDGAATIYTLPILGMEEYRGGMESLTSLLIAAGSDNTDFTYFTKEQQDAFWAAVGVAGPQFAQDIVDYCVANYADYFEKVNDSEVALGMYGWGFGVPSEDGTTITGSATGTEYKVEEVTVEDYWTEIFTSYEGDIQLASDTETAETDLFTLIAAELGDDAASYDAGVSTGESADSIEGLERTGDYSMRLTMSKYDAAAIYRLGFIIAPLHYYGSTDLYDYENNSFGFVKGDLSALRAKTTEPMGAGAYIFESYQNGVITYTANENYYLGAPLTKTILFKETPEADKLTGVVSGTFDISNPAMSVAVLESIKEYNSNGEIVGDTVHTSLIDNLGYGYIGINADNVSVGGKKDSEESMNLRAALATVFAVYRNTVINSYYGEMAAVIQYPISNTSWAAPKPADDGYQPAYSVDVDGNAIYTSSMSDEDKYVAALDAAVGFLKAAGYTYDEATGMFTDAPEGAAMTYEIIIPGNGSGDHPAFGILTATKEALATIGITIEINDPSDSNVLWNKIESGTAEMWTAAWQATADPDMYQVYHSTNVVGAGGTDSNSYGIQDSTLDELIMAGRESADQSYRKATYKEALEIIIDWAVEIPTYQRQNAIIFSSERVNTDTIAQDITPFWDWIAEVEKIEMN
ncbi:ABC transporter substrate-binding protein [Lachnospiraceae bacterium OttesenSCG-928-D06]|nr:ABC transporter substrate-binding protein [Lachnospiraceae bacterium OttesenSCG-928-D06]